MQTNSEFQREVAAWKAAFSKYEAAEHCAKVSDEEAAAQDAQQAWNECGEIAVSLLAREPQSLAEALDLLEIRKTHVVVFMRALVGGQPSMIEDLCNRTAADFKRFVA